MEQIPLHHEEKKPLKEISLTPESRGENINRALDDLDRIISGHDKRTPIPFDEFLGLMLAKPSRVLRNVFQVFSDMMDKYVVAGEDEYPNDPESIHYIDYDCNALLVEDSNHPFFADRLFANRLVNHVESLKHGSQQNKIYIFEGPHGSGKSTFLNNLLRKFEEYANTEEGTRYETVWRLNHRMLGNHGGEESAPLVEGLLQFLGNPSDEHIEKLRQNISRNAEGDFVEVPCASHDNPILMIPREHRRHFLDEVFKNDEFKWKLFTAKEYEWVFSATPCTICSSIYQALFSRLGSLREVLKMVYTRPYYINRRLGEGISVFNPGDKPAGRHVIGNPILQNRINSLFADSNQVRFLYSRYARSNNGIYALMDIKTQNAQRLIELHNIISEGVHKVEEEIEEQVDSLFFALMNPEDKKEIRNIQSFADRIQYIKVPYVLDLKTEIKIYRNIFGKHIDNHFLPRVLHNFARVIISTRINPRSDALLEWIGDPAKYRRYCDENLMLLKMEIYTGHIPDWLTEEDRKRLTAQRRRRIIDESEKEGERGISGRDSIKIFDDFYTTYAKNDELITMSTLCFFLNKHHRALIPSGFLDSMLRMYNFLILQEVKESLYYYNEDQIARDIKNYIFAVNFEAGSTEICHFTGDKLKITHDFLVGIEDRLMGAGASLSRRNAFRRDIQKEYTSSTLPQDILLEGKDITETKLYDGMRQRYVFNLKEKVLDPFLENNNFRNAVKDYGDEDFKAYDERIKNDVTFMMNNLSEKYHYSRRGAKGICMYVIDNDLARHFAKPQSQPMSKIE